MPLIEIVRLGSRFHLPFSETDVNPSRIRRIGNLFSMPYPIDDWIINMKDVQRMAREQGITSRGYNAYYKANNDVINYDNSTIQTVIQLCKIPQILASGEIISIEEECPGYFDQTMPINISAS